MFSLITWQEYIFSVIAFLIVYYGCVLIYYFRKEPKSSRHSAAGNTGASVTSVEDLPAGEQHQARLFSAVDQLLEELNETFEKAAKDGYKREGLLMALQAKLGKYKQLKGTGFQVSVNNHILRESKLMSVTVEENDLKNMW